MKRSDARTPFFSIVTPNYNSGDGLQRCIASLLDNHVDFEHIIIDDGSSDESFELAQRQLAAGDASQLVLLRNAENVGPGRTRNHGLEHVLGRYVLFMDADDYLAPGALDTLEAELSAAIHPEVAVFRYCLHGPQGEMPSLQLCTQPETRCQSEAFRDFMQDIIVSSPWGKAIRADLACSLRFPDLPVSQDGLYNLELFGRAQRVLYLPHMLYHFDKRSDGSLTRKPFNNRELDKFHDSWRVFESHYRRHFAAEHGDELLEMRALRFVGVSFIMRQAINKTQDDERVRRVVMAQLRKASWAALRKLSLKEKALLMSYTVSPALSRHLVRRSQYAS